MIGVWLLAAASLAAPEVEPGDPAEPGADPIEEGQTGPDRSAPPPVVPAAILELPQPTRHDLGGGSEAWHVRVPEVRKVAVSVTVAAGTVELDRTWTFDHRAMGWMMDVAAGTYGASELSEFKDLNEIDLWSSLGHHGGTVALAVPKDQLATGLELQRMVLQQPSFPKRDLKRYLKDQQLFYQVDGPASQRALASSAMAYAWLPAEHPYGTRPDLDGLKGVKPSALSKLHQRWLGAGPVQLMVVGDVAWSEVEPALRAMVARVGKSAPLPDELEVPLPKSRVVAVDLPGQEQVAVRMRTPGPSMNDADRTAMRAANWVFGGHFLSRLNTNLREEKGFTYGAGSRFRSGLRWGSVTVSVDVATENTAATIAEIRAELGRVMAGDVTADELDAARRNDLSAWNQTLQSADSAMELYGEIVSDRTTLDALRDRVTDIGAVTPDDTQRVAARWWGPDQPRVWVFVGDRTQLAPQLEQAGLEVQWVEPSDAILGRF